MLFQAALEARIAFAAVSGALCSYAYKRVYEIPLELALIIPGFASRWDLHQLLACAAPRPILIVSAGEDKYSEDAADVISRAQPHEHVTHFRDSSGHALTPARFDKIVAFLAAQAH